MIQLGVKFTVNTMYLALEFGTVSCFMLLSSTLKGWDRDVMVMFAKKKQQITAFAEVREGLSKILDWMPSPKSSNT